MRVFFFFPFFFYDFHDFTDFEKNTLDSRILEGWPPSKFPGTVHDVIVEKRGEKKGRQGLPAERKKEEKEREGEAISSSITIL